MVKLEEYITTTQAANLLGITVQQVRNLVKKGILKGIKPGHYIIIEYKSVLERLGNPGKPGRPKSENK